MRFARYKCTKPTNFLQCNSRHIIPQLVSYG